MGFAGALCEIRSAVMQTRQIEDFYKKAVSDLVDAHAKLKRSPLVLAVRYRQKGLDVHLLEVIEGFPGADEDPPFTTELAPNERFLILGKLYLTLSSPAQLRHAIELSAKRSVLAPVRSARKLLAELRADGEVLYAARTPPSRATTAKKLKSELALP